MALLCTPEFIDRLCKIPGLPADEFHVSIFPGEEICPLTGNPIKVHWVSPSSDEGWYQMMKQKMFDNDPERWKKVYGKSRRRRKNRETERWCISQ